MKKILLFYFVTCYCFLDAQLSLTQSFNEPKPGETETTYWMDTTAYSNGLPMSVSGNNSTWNFTHLKASQPVYVSNYLSAASVTSAASYTSCNLVQEAGTVYTFFKSTATPTTQTELLGIHSPSFTATFTNTGIVAKYPVNFGSSSTDNMSGTFTSTLAGNGSCSGNITTMADGSGTLNLPEGITLNNVLRVKSVQTITLTVSFFPVGVLKQTIYNYYHASQKFPVLSISYETLTSALSSTPNVSSSVMGSTAYFVTGLKEHSLESTAAVIYPNPSQHEVNIDLTSDLILSGCKIYDQLGQVVMTGNTSTLSIPDLKAGLYMLEIATDKGLIRKRLVKE